MAGSRVSTYQDSCTGVTSASASGGSRLRHRASAGTSLQAACAALATAALLAVAVRPAAGVPVTLSGYITARGLGVSGVTLNGLPGAPATDSTGFYIASIAATPWAGTVTPSKAGYVFRPESRDYSNLTAAATPNQNYAAKQVGQPVTYYYVNPVVGNDAYNGLSPAVSGPNGPKATIQAAVEASSASADPVIILAAGTYTGPGNRDISFAGRRIVVQSTDPDDPAVVAATVIDCQAGPADPHRAFVFQAGEDAFSEVAGLTIRNGYAEQGGAIHCNGASPTIRNCVISNNTATMYGGGAYCSDSEAMFADCEFSSNIVSSGSNSVYGGGLCCASSSVSLTRCVFSSNTASTTSGTMNYVFGGGMACLGGAPTLSRCTFVGNVASVAAYYAYGGGMYCEYAAPMISGCAFTGNTARSTGGYGGGSTYGGGLASSCGMPVIRNCRVTGNQLTNYGQGGGIYVFVSPQDVASLANSVITGNVGSSYGVYLNTNALGSGTISVSACTISGGTNAWGFTTLHGCILRGNNSISLDVTATYCNIEGGFGGQGNIDAEPKLTADGHLLPDSPCINAGDPAYMSAGQTDIDGEARIANGRIDIGADEFSDIDADGLPDWWEKAYFGSVTAADPNADPDGDGLTNVQEHARGSNPIFVASWYVNAAIGDDSFDGSCPTVSGTSGPKATIQAAIDAADPYVGSRVILAAGTYSGAGNREIDFKGKLLTVQSTNPADPAVVAATIIDGQGGGYRGFYFHGGEDGFCGVAGLTVTNATTAVYCESSSPTIRFCRLLANSNYGVQTSSIASPHILNCTIRDNEYTGISFTNSGVVAGCVVAWNKGSGIYPGQATITNCTIAFNGSGGNNGGVSGGQPTVRNCILWHNAGGSFGYFSSQPSVTYSAVEGGYTGQGNLNVDPGLRPDLHLRSDSPCINVGDPAYVPATGETDIDGEARMVGGRVDIGADEFLDSDADGMPDWWENLYFGSTTAAVAALDADGDGATNLQEYNRGSDPKKAYTYYVNAMQGNDAWDGTAAAWDGTHGPKATIQAAIDTAPVYEGASVILAAGTYTGAGNRDVNFKGKVLTVRSTDPASPPVVAATIIDCQGTQADPHRGFIFQSGEDAYCVLAGLTITNGFGPQVSSWYYGPTGGAILCMESAPTIRHCVIRGNRADYGGGIAARRGGPVITGCTIAGNSLSSSYSSSSFASAILSFGSGLTVSDCLITGNEGDAPAIKCTEDSSQRAPVRIVNCTITRNSDSVSILYNLPATISNCIIWGNRYGATAAGSATVTYSCIEGGRAGEGNIDVDPQLTPDGHLQATSPCINAGDPAYAAAAGEADLDAEPRIRAGRIDVGADEFADVDGDQLPDWWETRYFSSPTAADPAGNPDGDSRSNLQEYIRGSDPTKAPPNYYVDPAGNDAWDGLAAAFNGTSGPKATVQAAIDAADPLEGSSVILAAGTYTGPGNRDINFKGKAITVQSTDPANPNIVAATVVDCQGSEDDEHFAFYFGTSEGPESVLAGLTITNAFCSGSLYDHEGGAISCDYAGPTIRDCVVTRNGGYGGNGISCFYSNATIRNCQVTRNTGGSGIFCIESNATIVDCTISGNEALDEYGGGIACFYGAISILDCNITDNTSWFGGGGMYLEAPTFTIRGCTISGNSTTLVGDPESFGGGIALGWLGGLDSSPLIENCTIVSNSSSMGGGLAGVGYMEGYSTIPGLLPVQVRNCTIADNYAGSGGGVYLLLGGLELAGCEVSGNMAAEGAGLSCDSAESLRVEDCTIAGNLADNDGGGVFCYQSPLAMGRSVVRDNAAARGGGLCCVGGEQALRSCTIAWNLADYGGGLELINARPSILNCTILHNAATRLGGGLHNSGATRAEVASCILWQNTPFAIAGDLAVVTYSDVQGGFAGTGNLNVDPLLTPEGLLQPGSPCINAGDPAYSPQAGETDLDGDTRVAGGRIDMGSDEYAAAVRPGDINGDNAVDVIDLLFLVESFGTIAGDASYSAACDFNQDSSVDVIDLLTMIENWDR